MTSDKVPIPEPPEPPCTRKRAWVEVLDRLKRSPKLSELGPCGAGLWPFLLPAKGPRSELAGDCPAVLRPLRVALV
jgi:hypothetical protein